MFIQTNRSDQAFLENNDKYFIRFLNPNKFEIKENLDKIENAVSVILPNIQAFIPLGSLVNIDEEITKVTNEIKQLENEIKRCTKMLSNPNFLNKAPEHKVEEEKSKLKKYETSLIETKARLKELKG